MAVAAQEKETVRPALSSKARAMMEELNADASKSHIWVRTQMNAPAQRPWFTDTGGKSGAGEMASGRVAANQLKTLPYRWRWKEYRGLLDRIAGIASQADVSPIEFADRQSILLTNPGLGGRLQVTNTIRCAISIYNPGDIAPAHVHSPNASRTILSEKGGYTNVEGERCDAERGDIILTPNGTWHDHGNESTAPVIWIDMLDWPLMEFLDCAWVDQNFEPGSGSNAKSQDTVHKNGYSNKLYGSGGMVPTFRSPQIGFGRDPAPLVHFRGGKIRETLEALAHEKGDPHEGIQMQFVNPVTGKPVFSTLDYKAQLIRPGEELLPKRETCSTFIVVMAGKGQSEIGGETYDWEENDIMVVPNFLWRRHVNTGKSNAILYTVSDAALLRNIGQYRAQGRDSKHKVIQLVQ
ncbi:MAG TPA: cupin domain-containing protein [Xanthobacteraceae bacterium]|jgi:gentisate 1,2-dioxygenase